MLEHRVRTVDHNGGIVHTTTGAILSKQIGYSTMLQYYTAAGMYQSKQWYDGINSRNPSNKYA